MTGSISRATQEINRRRQLQMEYNEKHGITPRTIVKPVLQVDVDIPNVKHVPKKEIPNLIIE